VSERKTFVIAGDYRQFSDWCREALEMGTVPAIELGVRYVERADKLYGYREFDVIYYGTYYDRRDIQEILAVVSMMSAVRPDRVTETTWPDR